MIDTPDLMLQTLAAKAGRQVDALSDVLRVIRLSGGVFLEAELTAPWCISGKVSPDDCKPFLAAPRHVIASHFVAAGCMRLRAEGSDAIDVRAGEIVLLPHNDSHCFGSDLHRYAYPDNYRKHAERGGLLKHAHEHPGRDIGACRGGRHLAATAKSDPGLFARGRP